MKREIPVCTRCCFCLPLRYGLLAWGYFKLIADAFIIVILTFLFPNFLYAMDIKYMEISSSQELSDWLNTKMTISIITDVIFFTDFVVTIVFIIGGHKKNVKLIRVFYFLSIGMWVATFLLVCFTGVAALYRIITFKRAHHYSQFIYILLPGFCFFSVSLIVQTYFLMLLRSEIIKLRNSGDFGFVNNTAEAMCTIECKEVVTEAVKPNDYRDSETVKPDD
ncbi:hypothetical protein PYW08_011584 [Mythimna loreyi]|uniref:Uncharacterized protein n=1 Tax=Mythimna loreyi TaxID=667449 RepID=A0ACC2QPZ8_9NEOP|nr:hypothetical protein PYW08_011584 [Mythimna loreyi]